MENVALVRLWHAALAAMLLVALITQTYLSATTDDRSVVNLFSYFTIQSNILVMVTAALVAVRPERSEPWFGILRLAGLVGITVTGIVYSTILAGSLDLKGVDVALNIAFHYVSPAAALLGYVALKPRTPLAKSAWWFIAWPVLWLVYTLIRGAVSDPKFPVTDTTTSPVPYDFLDVDANGAGFVAIACVGVTILALLLAWGYTRLGRVRPSES